MFPDGNVQKHKAFQGSSTKGAPKVTTFNQGSGHKDKEGIKSDPLEASGEHFGPHWEPKGDQKGVQGDQNNTKKGTKSISVVCAEKAWIPKNKRDRFSTEN